MLIRSQDKKSLINMDNVTDLRIIFGSEIMAYYTTDQQYNRIGKYSDEAKAIKVLDMIQEKYSKIIDVGENESSTAIYDYPKIFQMPSDEELEV